MLERTHQARDKIVFRKWASLVELLASEGGTFRSGVKFHDLPKRVLDAYYTGINARRFHKLSTEKKNEMLFDTVQSRLPEELWKTITSYSSLCEN